MLGKIFGAFLAGAAAGVAIGILFSPDKGSETRRKISESANDLIDQLTDKISEGKEALSDLKSKVTSTAEKVSSMAHNHDPEEMAGSRHRKA